MIQLLEVTVMFKSEIIRRTQRYIKQCLPDDCTAHDWRHARRVCSMALKIAAQERKEVNKLVIILAALLHDLDDWKFNGKGMIRASKARCWLTRLKLESKIIEQVCKIIREMPFRGAKVAATMSTLEGKIVQDADRLDAMGAIGIARAFAYGGFKKRLIYHPRMHPKPHKKFIYYKKCPSSTINHFYEKLLLLKNLMNTRAARAIARQRHRFMLFFLRQLFKELRITKYKLPHVPS